MRSRRDSDEKAASAEVVVDHFLIQVACARMWFGLPPTHFRLKDLDKPFPGAPALIKKFVEDSIRRRGNRFFLRPSMLDPKLEIKTTSRQKTDRFNRRQVHAGSVEILLRTVLELMLGTIVILPDRDSKRNSISRSKVAALACSIAKYGQKLDRALQDEGLRELLRAMVGTDKARFNRLVSAPKEIICVGEALQAASRFHEIPFSKPNPQVRFALVLIDWVKACSGKPNYSLVTTLIQAAYDSAHKDRPKWTDRLEIERHGQRKYRNRWVSSVLPTLTTPKT